MTDFSDLLTKLEQHFKNQLPLIAYRKPNSMQVNTMLQSDDELHVVSDYKESGFIIAPFDDRQDVVLIPTDESELITCNSVAQSTSSSSISSNKFTERSHSEIVNDLESRINHIQLVQKGIDSISSNQLKKVVLSRCETLQISDSNPINLFKRLLQSYPTAFVYCFYHPKVGLWLGATPETLLKVEGNRFETMALAGTQLYVDTIDVKWKDKERIEQQFVTDFVVDKLKDQVESLKVSNTKTVRAGSVLHLLTKISGTLNSGKLNLQKLLKALHPTPAICGIPKTNAKQFILTNENYNREFYSGFLGELNLREQKSRNLNKRNIENNAYQTVKKVSNLYVNLRCMKLMGNEATIYVGGGITKDSIPENEWIETVNKSNTIKKVLS